MATEDGADVPYYAGTIVVRQNQHRAAKRRFHVDAADGNEARRARLEHGAFHPPLACARVQLDGQKTREMPRAGAARLDDFDTALAGRGGSVHDRDGARENRPQYPGRHARRQHPAAAIVSQCSV